MGSAQVYDLRGGTLVAWNGDGGGGGRAARTVGDGGDTALWGLVQRLAAESGGGGGGGGDTGAFNSQNSCNTNVARSKGPSRAGATGNVIGSVDYGDSRGCCCC